jgi:DNA-binding MarR family transcriptional regulator
MGEREQQTQPTVLTATHGCDSERYHTGSGEDLDAADGLIQLCRLVRGIHARISDRHDLTPVQARLICVLAFGPRGMAELAQCFGVERATLTGLVDRAEQRGLVMRSAVPGDRRALHVTLTDTGRRAATAFHAEATEELNQLLSSLPSRDREQFRRSIVKIIAGRRTPNRGAGMNEATIEAVGARKPFGPRRLSPE